MPEANFPIIGLGASAGGLDAFENFFRHIKPDSGMAFILISHLDPGHASLMTRDPAKGYHHDGHRSPGPDGRGTGPGLCDSPEPGHVHFSRGHTAHCSGITAGPSDAHRFFSALPGRRPGRKGHRGDPLRKAFSTIIQVMVSVVETRDPYTAGHQTRTADLARAMATEMGLSQDKIDGLRMAGSIHDIGKLSIPAEILSKPTKLSEIEFSLIKEHPQKGYDILKNVESPWPLAEIVYQHHERMNGSGYPRGLKGEEISHGGPDPYGGRCGRGHGLLSTLPPGPGD